MAEKLSQGQIDALLKRLNSDQPEPEVKEDDRRIKEYDFRSPKKFMKEQLKTLDSLHETFSRILSSYLSGILRVYCEIAVLQIEEQRYFEYGNAIPDSALLGIIDVRPEDNRYSEMTLILNMSTAVGYLMIDRLLGGPGSGSSLTRDYTDIELAILHNVFEKITAQLESAWCNYIDVDAELASIETNSRLLQALAPEDTVVIVMLNVKIKDLQGSMSICIPATNLEEMISSFSVKYSRSGKRQTPANEELKKQIIMDSLVDSDLEIKAVLGELSLDLREIMNLQLDDVIPINKGITQDIQITIDDVPWYSAKLGECKLKKAVKLTGLIDEE